MIDYTCEVSYIYLVLFRQDTYKELYEFAHLT
jgi:hypothetical protein